MLARLKYWLMPGSSVPGPRFVVHQRYQLNCPFPLYDNRRPFRILNYLRSRRLLRKRTLRRPRPVSIAQLEMVHDSGYLHSMEQPGALESILGAAIDPASQDRFLCWQRMVCGGTVRAARIALRRKDLAINLGGGFHHAYRDRGSGFCVFNDVALAVAALRSKGFAGSVLVVDLDLHDGDGTRAMFAEDTTVHTFSIHNKSLGSTEALASTCVELGTEVDDEAYLAAVREHLPPVVRDCRPGLVFYLAGSDPSVDDKLGDWRISLDGLLARDRLVLELTKGLPQVILLAGGYGPRAWRHGAALFSWILTGSASLEIPMELELPVDHYRKLAKLMKKHPGLLPEEENEGSEKGDAGLSPEDDWGLQAEDVGPPGKRTENRFLGLFSRYGMELAFEEYGLMKRLRALGFKELRLALDLDDPLGHTLRLQTGGPKPLVVFETRLRIDRSNPRDGELLAVEWLLIQDTRSRFEMHRPLLPGQSYPGLGLLRDTAAVLVVLCERLDLDGLVFTPSHFHLAALARPMAFSPDPEIEGAFQAVLDTVKNRRLREAAVLVEKGKLLDGENHKPWEWQPSPLIIPVSEKMKARFGTPEYQEAVGRARSARRLEIAAD